jgi:hypothetical protein
VGYYMAKASHNLSLWQKASFGRLSAKLSHSNRHYHRIPARVALALKLRVAVDSLTRRLDEFGYGAFPFLAQDRSRT